MYRIAFACVDIIAASAFIIPLFAVFFGAVLRRGAIRTAVYIIMGVYFAAVFQLVGMPSVTSFTPDFNVEFVPFFPMLSDIKNSLLNIALFVPLGFILPLLWVKFEKLKYIALAGFSLSAFIEVMQIFTLRATDINDLFTNTCGAVVGFLIFCVLGRLGMSKKSENNARKSTKDFWILLSFSAFIMFFAQPFVSNLLWNFVLDNEIIAF